MTHHARTLVLTIAAPLLLGACDRGASSREHAADSPVPVADAAAMARDVVLRFGSRMQAVSLLAPDSTVEKRLRDAYGDLVTPELLADWTTHPADAPGRRVSSPWPDRIRVDSLWRRDDQKVDVHGTVVYVSSTEQSGGGAAATEPVRLQLRRAADGSWRIAAYSGGTESRKPGP